jgi:septal ring factor EnvC (AmiA/AmiB activator)
MGIRIKMSETIYIQENSKKRKATAEEIAQFEKDQAEYAEQQRLLEAEIEAKKAKLDSAKAKLAALGLDEEEVAAIVGGI